MTMIAANLQTVRSRILAACHAAQRDPAQVGILAVSKTFGPEAVAQAYAAGQTSFGENYIQEAVEKMAALPGLALEWHCIGPVQGNKTRLVAENFAWVHTVDRLKIAQRLSEQRPAELPPLQICIQVNIDTGINKSGVSPANALTLAREVQAMHRLQLRGLMCIPEPAAQFDAACAVFATAKKLFDALNKEGLALDTLSMGMSADLEAAIHAGSTLVRVGTAIFGRR